MQKFTVFSLLLSFSVILILSDIIFHDYLHDGAYKSAVSTNGQSVLSDKPLENADVKEDSSADSSDTVVSEAVLASIPEAKLSVEALKMAGFKSPVLKENVFSGNIFNFISFSDQPDAFVYEFNFFDGENFVGTLYDLEYASDTGGFQAYLTLRERATALASLGVLNETNGYGDTSFYFNHKTKTKTVHLIIRKANSIYGFEYAYSFHDKMKKVFEMISE